MPSDLKIISLHLFTSANCPTFVVLEPSFVFFLLIVVCKVNAGEEQIGIIL